MYYIGICDDDTAFIEYVKRLFLNKCKDITFFEYISGQALIEDMQNRDKLDCLILDVCMPEMDGNEAAGKFREWFPDTLLIFLFRGMYANSRFLCEYTIPLLAEGICGRENAGRN